MTPDDMTLDADAALRIIGPDDDGLFWLHAKAPSGISAGWVLAGKGVPVGGRVLDELSAIIAADQPPTEDIFEAMGLPSVPPIPNVRRESNE